MRKRELISALVNGFFASGGMVLQVNMLDHTQRLDDERHPEN